jgi:hypothetical protein
MSKRYIEIVGDVAAWSLKLSLWDRWLIGKFTRENVAAWLEGRHPNWIAFLPPQWFERHTSPRWVGFLPAQDFHAVCGDIDIPWATKEGRDCYQRTQALQPRERDS